MEPMEAIKATFFQECSELLIELETGLSRVSEGDQDPETINAVFRAVHSVKGGAGAFELTDLVTFAHAFETVLDRMRNHQIERTAEVLTTLLRSADALSDLVAAARDGCAANSSWLSILAEIEHLGHTAPLGEMAACESPSAVFSFAPIPIDDDPADEKMAEEIGNEFRVEFKPHSRLYANANDPSLILKELGRLGECSLTCDWSAVPDLDGLNPSVSYLRWSADLKTHAAETEIREVFEFVDTDCDLIITPVPAIRAAKPSAMQFMDVAPGEPIGAFLNSVASAEPKPVALAEADSPRGADRNQAIGVLSTIRVELDRVDRLIDLVGELVINRVMLMQRVSDAGISGISAINLGLEDLEHLTREIQDGVMAIRAQPVKSLFQRMARIVREAAQATQKQLRLRVEGEGTEIDKTVIERLADPLTHMIRNAIDHGIETPELRLAAGKSLEGTVRLTAAHRSGRVIIEVADDGAGINRSRVREVAIAKNLIPSDSQLSDSEIDNLLFLPGFSTASTVSSLSGRGVGMDVVKRSIQALGGRMTISSQPGRGTTFSMSLPLTLAVVDGMVVTAKDQTLIVPITAIIETLKPERSDVHGMGGLSQVIEIRGNFIPLIDVAYELGYRDRPIQAISGVCILVETANGQRVTLLADAIQDQRQVVIKSLETNYGRIDGIAAATILGDGRVALILDVDAIVTKSENRKDRCVQPSLLTGDWHV